MLPTRYFAVAVALIILLIIWMYEDNSQRLTSSEAERMKSLQFTDIANWDNTPACGKYPPCEDYFDTNSKMGRWDKCVYTDPKCQGALKNQATLPNNPGCKTLIYAKDIPLVEDSSAPLQRNFTP